MALNGNATSGQPGENITIGTDIENLTGGNGDDTISGSPTLGLKVTLTGGPGNDFFVQTGTTNDSNDTIVGAAPAWTPLTTAVVLATPTSRSKAPPTTVAWVKNDNVGIDVENVTTGSGADYVLGSALNNRINGGSGVNFLNGAGGDDTFDQGGEALNTGSDTIVGGRRRRRRGLHLTHCVRDGEPHEHGRFR